jgi:serine protease AprX
VIITKHCLHRWIVILLLFSLLAPALPARGAFLPAPEVRAQPLLVQLADRHPNAVVGVIVQKDGATRRVEQRVAALGGEITKELGIIQAFVAQMSARSAVELAASPGVRWVSLDAPVQSSAETASFTAWGTEVGSVVANGFQSAASMVDSAFGPNDVWASGAKVKGAFDGFYGEMTPGLAIYKVEVLLQVFVPDWLGAGEDPVITVYVDGVPGAPVILKHQRLNNLAMVMEPGLIALDVTASRTWQWADLDRDLQVVIDQAGIRTYHSIYYDSIGVRVTSQTGSDPSGGVNPTWLPSGTYNPATMLTAFNKAVRAVDVWNEAPGYLQGQGVGVAVVDSGVIKNSDLGVRVIRSVNFNNSYHDSSDRYGHGTFVASLVGGDGTASSGQYVGIAPRTNLINVRVSNDQGAALESDVVEGLQWILENKTPFNIRVVNVSLNSSVAQSYHTSPLDAAVEILWFNGIVVVVSAGNNGTATLYPPANDPFVITVGATDDLGTPGLSDDQMATFSAYGVTESGFAKPDLVAPGRNIIGFLPENGKLTIGRLHPANRVNQHYFRMSGTSMAAPMVSGAVALLLQDEPGLNPDQVKYRLKATAVKAAGWPAYNTAKAGAGYLDVFAAVHGTSQQSANTGQTASQLLWTGSEPITWGSVSWNSVSWNSVSWNSVSWNSVSWNSVSWNSDYWGP